MKRLAVGIALAVLLPNCIQANPVAEEQKSAEQQLRDSIGPWCAEICQHGIDCQQDTSEDCPQQCADFMAVFVDHGDPCVTLGQEVQKCLSSLPVCEQLGADNACTEPASNSYEQCKDAAYTGPSDNRPIYCDDGGGTSAGKAPGANGEPPMTTSCDSYFEGCSDGASRRVSCRQVDGALVCNCFRDGVVNGVAFTPASGDCPWEYAEVNEPCGWNLQY